MTAKERSVLRSKASLIQPIFQIGKQGVTAALIEEIKAALYARELIKITVLRNADIGAKEIICSLAEQSGAEAVQAIGNKIVLYKLSEKEGIKHVLEV